MRLSSDEKVGIAFLVFWIAAILAKLAFTGFIVYAVMHYALKYW